MQSNQQIKKKGFVDFGVNGNGEGFHGDVHAFFTGGWHGSGGHGSAFFTFSGQLGHARGEIIKLSTYQISNLAKSGLVGLRRKGGRKTFIGTFTRFRRGGLMDAVATELHFLTSRVRVARPWAT